MTLRPLPLLALAALAGCAGEPAPPPPADAPPLSGWPKELAEQGWGEAVDAAVVGRWLQGKRWAPPRQPPALPDTPAGRAVAARWIAEDERALAELGHIHDAALCAVGRRAEGFGGLLPAGHAEAVAACRAVGDEVGAAAAAVLAGDAEANGAPLRLKLQVRGVDLDYGFWPASARPLPSPLPAEPAAALVGTARWGGQELPAPADAADAEAELDRQSRFARAAVAELEPTLGGAVAGWIERSAARDLALRGDAETRTNLLTGLGGSRPDDEADRLDPWAACALARARYEQGEWTAAGSLLRGIAAHEGWEAAEIAGSWIARQAVLPGAPVQEIRR